MVPRRNSTCVPITDDKMCVVSLYTVDVTNACVGCDDNSATEQAVHSLHYHCMDTAGIRNTSEVTRVLGYVSCIQTFDHHYHQLIALII